jgi:hypothetical protein
MTAISYSTIICVIGGLSSIRNNITAKRNAIRNTWTRILFSVANSCFCSQTYCWFSSIASKWSQYINWLGRLIISLWTLAICIKLLVFHQSSTEVFCTHEPIDLISLHECSSLSTKVLLNHLIEVHIHPMKESPTKTPFWMTTWIKYKRNTFFSEKKHFFYVKLLKFSEFKSKTIFLQLFHSFQNLNALSEPIFHAQKNSEQFWVSHKTVLGHSMRS